MTARLSHRVSIVAIALLLSACAILNGPRTMTVPTEQIQASIDRRLPMDVRYMELFDLHLSRPKLVASADAGRIAVSMDVVLAPPFLKRTWKGSITLSGVPQTDALRHAVVMNAPRLEAFNIEGFDPKMSRQITQYGDQLADQILRGIPLITYQEMGSPLGGSSLVPDSVVQTRDGIVVTFAPVAQPV
jgi:hypothetical protein